MNHPADNQIQITVFGPGIGESILIHLGNRNWIIIDSCICEGQPVALGYLNEIGANVKNDVKIVVATHWDEDHIRGLSDIISECRSAKFVLPLVFTDPDFIEYLIEYENTETLDINIPESEISSCIRNLSKGRTVDHFASQNTIIWRRDAGQFAHKKNVEVLALSPSEHLQHEFIKKIAKNKYYDKGKLVVDRHTKKRLPKEDRNVSSVAILVSIGEFSILLGSDVKASNNEKFGWKNIIQYLEYGSKKSKIYKVAHHGSEKSDTEEIWSKLLVDKPYSIVTPFTRSSLPKDTDVDRIKNNSFEAYITNNKKLMKNTKFEKNYKNFENSKV